MHPEAQNPRNLKSCFLNLSYTSGGTPSRIERIITGHFKKRGFDVKTGRMAPAGGQTDKGILRVIKSCGFGIVVYNEFRHNISYEWGLMDALGMPVILFLRNDAHIDIDREFSDKKATTFVGYSEDSEKEEIIKELENDESLKSAVENIERSIAEQISSEEAVEANEASKLLIESNMSLGEFGEETKEEIKSINEIINALGKVENLTEEGHSNKATAYYYAKNYNEAEKELRAVLQINPDLAEAHNNFGSLLKELERYDEAEKEYREAIRIDPNDAAVHNNFGNMLKDLERHEEAEKEYTEAIRIYPDLAASHYNLGILLKELERYDEAEKEYREAIRIDPDDVATHYNFGGLLKELERYDEAEKEYREAIRIDPDLAEAHYNLGNLLDSLERHDEAEKEYRETIRIDPNDGEAHANLGDIFLRIERLKEAKNEFEIAKELFCEEGGRDISKYLRKQED
jgi:tetratricopeptide (TPR) repeat protein